MQNGEVYPWSGLRKCPRTFRASRMQSAWIGDEESVWQTEKPQFVWSCVTPSWSSRSYPKPMHTFLEHLNTIVRTSPIISRFAVASDLNIPGLYLVHDFISTKEEEELLQAVDSRPWQSLSKRRVQHYGYECCYDIRNINTWHCLGELPSFVSPVLKKKYHHFQILRMLKI